ncbi:peptide chain release factor 2 [Candidatus Epulonipiscium viviparus]|uniref:peptide chain release factor 2 n=1 Tax=Candidatus Epulonipiscium viviparus TaxID=420336 RepID=UPI0012EA2396
MIELEQLSLSLAGYKDKIDEMGRSLDVTHVQEQITELETISATPDFWQNSKYAQSVLQELKDYKEIISKYKKLCNMYEDVLVLIDMGIEEHDADMCAEAISDANSFIEFYDNLRTSTLLDGEYDKNDAIISLHAGAGGTEACDWNNMLLRMYTRWAEKHGFKSKLLDILDGEEAGVKSATLEISGQNAYGYLKSEKGIHRLVRISPFDSGGRRHTSFASLDVMPKIDDTAEITINPEDLQIDTYRSSGAGGQHVNTTDSAVRITHKPSGIVVQCQNERSQIQNRETCMKMLASKLLYKQHQEQLLKIDEIRGEKKDIAWGSQIRSYVFHPYNMVKDHRTNQETGNTGAVMDGDIDAFVNAYLAWLKS